MVEITPQPKAVAQSNLNALRSDATDPKETIRASWQLLMP